MKLKLSSLKVGDVIPVDVGYNGMIDMVDLPIVAISNGRNLWTNEPEKVVEVRHYDGSIMSLNNDMFA